MKITEIVKPVSTKYGAPMGRHTIGKRPEKGQGKVYNKRVRMCKCCGAYDIGGAYWGIGSELRVRYTKDLSFIEYYRL